MFDQDYSGGASGKLSSFDDTPKNLLVLSDNESGTVALFHQEYYTSKKDLQESDFKIGHGKYINKFIINLYPRVLLVPSISDEVGPVLDHTIVRSPAQHVLVSIDALIRIRARVVTFL